MMQEPKYHLVNDFGVSKQTLERNFDADHGERDADWAQRVRALLDQPTELYTFDEMADLIRVMSSAHDDQVVENPDDFRDADGRPSIEIWQSGQALDRQARLEERLRDLRAKVRNAAPPPSTAGYSGTMTLEPTGPATSQLRVRRLSPESLGLPVVAVGGLLTLALMGLIIFLWILLSPSSSAQTPLLVPSIPMAAPALPLPVINAFAINPDTVSPPQCATLSWDVGGTVNSVRVFRNSIMLLDNAPLTGTAPDCSTTAGKSTFRIEARNVAGEVAMREVGLSVNPKPTANVADATSAADQSGPPITPTMPQFIVYVVIALIGAYLAATMTGTRYPFAVLGAFIVALVGEWMIINVLRILVVPEVAIAGVPVVTAVLGSLLLALLWVVVVHGRQYRRSSHNGRGA